MGPYPEPPPVMKTTRPLTSKSLAAEKSCVDAMVLLSSSLCYNDIISTPLTKRGCNRSYPSVTRSCYICILFLRLCGKAIVPLLC